MKGHLLVLLGLFFVIENGFSAELKLAQPFQDHMVLQRQMPIAIWGWDDAGKTITVKLGDKSATATSDNSGYWRASLPATEANSTGQSVTITDGVKTITLNDVLIGEVWLCAGQSNMSRPVKTEIGENPQAPNPAVDADYPLVRYINYPYAASDTPLPDMDPIIDGKTVWQPMNAQTVGDSMCMAFFFGRDLYKDLQVPVGLVQIAVAGTTQTAWTTKEVLDATAVQGPRTYSYDDCYAAAEKSVTAGKDPYKSWSDFKTADAAWRAKPTGRWIASLAILDYPSVLYNALIYPLAPMAIRGVVWHQGEAGPNPNYGTRLVAMANQWRKLYDQNFYFIYGSMTRFTNKPPPMAPSAEAIRSGIDDEFALAQTQFGPDGKGVLVPFVDLGNVGTHWERKDEAGRRLALAAMDHAYGKPSVYSGPQLIEGKIEGSTVTCRFSNVGTGLKYQPSIDGISGFILQGKAKSVWATPTIQGTDTVVVSDPAVPDPINLYYAYASNPHETLFNSEDMPGYSFCLKPGLNPQPRETSPFELVSDVKLGDSKAALHVSEVRRYAYVVGFLSGHPAPGANTAKCYIPKEWAKPAASQDGKDISLGDLVTDSSGNRFAQISVETNAPPVVLYDASHPDALTSANTHRY